MAPPANPWSRGAAPTQARSVIPNLHFQLNNPQEDFEDEVQAGVRHGRRRKFQKPKQKKQRAQRPRVPRQPAPRGPPDDDHPKGGDDNDHGADNHRRRPNKKKSNTPQHGANRHIACHHNITKSTKARKPQKPRKSGKRSHIDKNHIIAKDFDIIWYDDVGTDTNGGDTQLSSIKIDTTFPTGTEYLTTTTMATQRAPPATERASQGATRQEMQYVFVEGTFADHAQDMANHLNLELDVKPLIEKGQKDEVLKKLILASTALNSEPEKEFCSHYNLLIYLVLESDKAGMLLPRVCDNLTKPITSSPVNGPGLALGALTTIFNLLQKRTEQNNELRFNVFVTIVRFVKLHGMYADIRKCLPSIKGWLTLWETDEDDQRKLFLDIAELAHDAGDDETSYQHVLNALRTFDEDEVKSEEAQQLALRALKIALLSSTHYDFQDVIAVPAIQNLSDSHPVYFELLTIFAEKDLEDYNDFNDEHEGFIEKEHLDGDKLLRKIRLLTFTSLAASTPSREIPYEEIAKALQIGPKEVELWTIDVIRAGLVEGKLSQQKQVFLVHKTLYRVFGEKQWREVGLRLKSWSTAINNLLTVLRNGQSDVEAARRRETEEIERRLANAGMNEGSGGGRRGGGDRPPRRERTDDDD